MIDNAFEMRFLLRLQDPSYEMNRLLILTIAAYIGSVSSVYARSFISHRGLNLDCTVAGENSLEAIELAKRAGFDCIEMDVRTTADDSLIVMHDATLNRTCIMTDGSDIRHQTAIDTISFATLRKRYVVRADADSMRTAVPTLREYLMECRRNRLLPFIEPKLYDPTGRHYCRIIAIADDILGRGKYIITSNNRANDIIRRTLGVADIPLMGILYQTTFENISSLGNVIMAVSASRFDEHAFSQNVARSHITGLLTESHADTYSRLFEITSRGVDYVSTDYLAPDYHGQGRTEVFADEHNLKSRYIKSLEPARLGAVYLIVETTASAKINLAGHIFNVSAGIHSHQVIVHDTTPELTVITKGEIPWLSIRQIEF